MCRDFCDSIVASSGFADAFGVPSLCSPGVNDLRADDVGGRAGASSPGARGLCLRGGSRSLSNVEDEARWLGNTPVSTRLVARRIRSALSRSTLGRSQLRLDSALLRPPTTSPFPLPLPLPVPALVDERASLPDRSKTSSLAPRRCCRPLPALALVTEDSRNTLPTPSKKPVIVRTSSSLTLNVSRKSPPTSFHNPAMSTSLPGLASEISASISRSSARFVELRSIPLICSEKRTTACALRKTSGTAVADESPIGGRRDRSASNIESDSSISRRCSTACSSSGRAGISRGRVRGEPYVRSWGAVENGVYNVCRELIPSRSRSNVNVDLYVRSPGGAVFGG